MTNSKLKNENYIILYQCSNEKFWNIWLYLDEKQMGQKYDLKTARQVTKNKNHFLGKHKTLIVKVVRDQ